MVGPAEALQIMPIPEQFRLPFMRLLVVDNCGRFDSASLSAHLTEWLIPKLAGP
jgi:hypothetical protein